MDRTEALTQFLTAIEDAEVCYCMNFLALYKLYDGPGGVASLPNEAVIPCIHPRTNQRWHEAIPRMEAVNVIPIILGAASIHAAMMVSNLLESYLIRMCAKVYPPTLDKSWFNLGVVEAATGVDPAACVRWDGVEQLQHMKTVFNHQAPQTPDESISQQILFGIMKDVKAFAIDFECAFMIAHPEVKE